MEAAIEHGVEFAAWMSQAVSTTFNKKGSEPKRKERNVRNNKNKTEIFL